MSNSELFVQIDDGTIHINIEKEIVIDTKTLLRMQIQGGWGQGITKMVDQVMGAISSDISAELEQVLHSAVIRGEVDYKAAK